MSNVTVDEASGLTIADYEEVLADKRRLTRELDVALHGEHGAAKQASLCDLVGPAKRLREQRDDLLRACKALDGAICNGFDTPQLRHAGRMALATARAAIAKAEGSK